MGSPQPRSIWEECRDKGELELFFLALSLEIIFFFFQKNLLFLWLRQVLVAARGIFVVARGLLCSCDARALECVGSVVVARRLSSCSARA